MSTEGVNNNSVRSASYVLGMAGAGALAGAGTAYVTKPYLKKGEVSDEFVSRVIESASENNPEINKVLGKYEKLLEELEKVKDNNALQKFIQDKKINIPQKVANELNKASFEEAKTIVEVCMGADNSNGLRQILEKINIDPAKMYEQFTQDSSKMTKEGREYVQKAIKGIKGKYALIYAGIAGIVGGTIGLVYSIMKK